MIIASRSVNEMIVNFSLEELEYFPQLGIILGNYIYEFG